MPMLTPRSFQSSIWYQSGVGQPERRRSARGLRAPNETDPLSGPNRNTTTVPSLREYVLIQIPKSLGGGNGEQENSSG